jgi:hypothetical protein
MSITINGATNTLTAASGLAIAGNTAITGTLSATGAFTSGGALTVGTVVALQRVAYGYGGGFSTLQVGIPGSNTGTVAICVDASAIVGSAFNGQDQVLIPKNGFAFPNNAATNWIGCLARNTSDQIIIGPSISGGVTSGPLTVSTTGLAVTGTLSASDSSASDSIIATFSNPHATGGAVVEILRGASNVRAARTSYASLWHTGVLRNGGSASTGYSISSNTDIGVGGKEFNLTSTLLSTATGVIVSVLDTTDATSTTAASLKTAGGLAVAKKGYFGDNIVMASGKGIDFSATANGSGTTTSEVLSDYEEGTWTPVVYGSTGAGTLTYTTQYGTYTKIGNTVHVTFSITVNAVSVGATGTILISGLPFSTSNDSALYRTGGSVSNTSGLQVNGTAPFVELAQNNTIFTLYGFNNNAAFGSSDASSIGAGDFLNGSITYKSA